MQEFYNQVAVITGAASGLGSAIAARLAAEGVKLALLDLNAAGLREEAGKMPSETRTYSLDVTDRAQVVEVVGQVAADFGTIHILINSAGITGVTNCKSHETDPEDVRKVFDVNFFGSYLLSRYVLPHMLEQGYGRVLHIASIAGKEGNAGMLAYSASKAAVIGMAKVQGKEYAETGITVNALAPAVIRTPMVEAMPEVQVRYMTDKIPAQRPGTLAELTGLVAYIVSPANSYTTGFTFDLSGGRATY